MYVDGRPNLARKNLVLFVRVYASDSLCVSALHFVFTILASPVFMAGVLVSPLPMQIDFLLVPRLKLYIRLLCFAVTEQLDMKIKTRT